MSTTLSKSSSLKSMLSGDAFKAELAKSLPKHMTPDRFARIAITALTRTPKLLDCSQESLFQCLLDMSAYGVEPNGRDAHLIPYGKVCTLILDYKGIIKLIRQSEGIDDIYAKVVYEKDDFSISYGVNGGLSHTPYLGADRGDLVGCYSFCTLSNGIYNYEYMSSEDIDTVKKKSQSGGKSGPWKDFEGEMWKKSVVRRHSKFLPLSSESFSAIETLDRDYTDAKPVRGEVAPFNGFADSPTDETDARLVIEDDRLEFIKDRLEDEGKSQQWFMSLVKGKFPNCPAENIAQLTHEESSAAIAAWEAGA